MSASDSAKSRMERILRLHEQIDALKLDIRQVYAEEKADGGDKTAMGAAVSYIRKRDKEGSDLADREAMADVYVAAYDAVGTRIATHTHAPASYSEAKGMGVDAAFVNSILVGGELTDNQNSGRNGPAAAGSATDEAETSSAPVTHSHSSEIPLRSDTAEALPSSTEVSATIPHLRPSSQAAGSPASDAAPREAGATTAAASRLSSGDGFEPPAFLRKTEVA